ncbi:MAG TPA: MEDS domain-containing protein, partial [Actinomycetota bacterium]
MMQEIKPSLQDGPSAFDRVRDGFSHEAFVYTTSQEFLAGTVPFVLEGLQRDEQVLAVLSSDKIDLLRTEMAKNAHRVRFADMAIVGANPARIIPVWMRFVDQRVPGRGVRGIGEPIHAAR